MISTNTVGDLAQRPDVVANTAPLIAFFEPSGRSARLAAPPTISIGFAILTTALAGCAARSRPAKRPKQCPATGAAGNPLNGDWPTSAGDQHTHFSEHGTG